MAFLGLRCGPVTGASGEQGSRALYELERLAFVPKAQSRNHSYGDCSLWRSIVMDRFEFTRSDLLFYSGAQPRAVDQLPWGPHSAGYDAEKLEWPAYLSFPEAEQWAAARGMRLPTPAEWLHVAMGRSWLRYPWGSAAGRFANTWDLGLGRPTRVGTFENGKVQLFECYDMMGNVWEWVTEEVPSVRLTPSYRQKVPLPFPQDRRVPLSSFTSVMGGGFDSQFSRLYSFELFESVRELRFYSKAVDKETVSPSIGARMCADAEEYLWAKSPLWGGSARARTRVEAVARRWARDDLAVEALVELLGTLRSRAGAPPSLDWLARGLEARGS